jgi:hypothetical protein
MQQPSTRETELAQAQIDELNHEFRSKRSSSIILSGLCIIFAAIMVIPMRLPMIAFCFFVAGIILLLRYFDANSQLHDVELRSTKTLYPRLSLLESKPSGKPTVDHSLSK